METKTILIIIAALIVLLFVVSFLTYFSKGKRKGRSAERKVAGVIKKLGKNDKVKVLNNAFLPLYRKTCEIDHLVFGRFGVLVVETKGISGTLSGKSGSKYLKHSIGEKTHKLYNPELQNKTHIDNVTHHLKKGGYENVPVNGVVVFADNDLRLEANVGMKLDQFKDYFNSNNLPDAGCNQDILYEYFDKLRVRNPIRKFFHRFNKKDWD
ncbi:MAG: NERD domain-containing protein [Ruminococcus sp.]|nr:NERD domain-containing protein [Ruminococcus sp.]